MAVSCAAFTLTAAVSGLRRTLEQVIAVNNEQDQWQQVLQHEARFVKAIQQGSAAEDTDLGP